MGRLARLAATFSRKVVAAREAGVLSDTTIVRIFCVVPMDSILPLLRIERLNLPSRAAIKCPWTRRRWGAARNDSRVGRQHSVWVMCPGDRGGSDAMLSVRRRRAVLAKPQIEFRDLSVRIVAKFLCIESSATWYDTSNVISRDALSSASI